MRRSLAVILSTATLGTMVAATGCAEHRYPTSNPYYSTPYYGYNGWDAAEQARYREWLAERRYDYIEYNRLSAERQREYWAWRNSHYGQSVQDQYRNYNRERMERQRDDRDRYVRDRDDRDRRYADRDDQNGRYRRDRDDHDRSYARDRDNHNRTYQNRSHGDHDRKSNDRDHGHDHR